MSVQTPDSGQRPPVPWQNPRWTVAHRPVRSVLRLGRREVPVSVVAAAALALCVPVAVGAALAPWPTTFVVVVVATIVAVVLRPRLATYIYLGLTPLIVGLGRGSVVPGIRPNELVLAVLLSGVALGPVLRWVRGERGRPVLHPVDWVAMSLAVTSSVTTVLWMFARGDSPVRDDALHALTMWKILALYVLVRLTIRTSAQARTAALIAMISGSVVAVIGIAQAVGVGPVVDALNTAMPGENRKVLTSNRASSTIATPIGFADHMMLCGALALGWLLVYRTRRALAAAAVALFALATLASGQISAALGLVTMVAVFGFMLRRAGLVILLGVPGAAAALVALQPVVAARMEALDPATGLPVSWTGPYGRISNLTTHILPRLQEHANWMLGVQPCARVPAPESWREYVYIESGYAWLLWCGGLPLLLAFGVFVLLVWRAGHQVGERASGGWLVHAVAATGGILTIAALMVLDPHLSIRGSSDLLFPIVAITVTAHQLHPRPPRSLPHRYPRRRQT
ncbi:MAG: hypothetical protein CSA58_01780 [Micrococcales bacterium]|nr:MAG: hypothetical protein CSA58_01780 [Micrococcales bacterium]